MSELHFVDDFLRTGYGSGLLVKKSMRVRVRTPVCGQGRELSNAGDAAPAGTVDGGVPARAVEFMAVM